MIAVSKGALSFAPKSVIRELPWTGSPFELTWLLFGLPAGFAILDEV